MFGLAATNYFRSLGVDKTGPKVLTEYLSALRLEQMPNALFMFFVETVKSVFA
jgi:hypothetical protein